MDLNKRQFANLFFASTQFVAPFYSEITGMGTSIEKMASASPFPQPEVPAGYAFGIWFVIFILALIYALIQAQPAQKDNALFQRIGWDTAIVFALNSLWMILAQQLGDGWHLVAIITALWLASLRGFLALVRFQKQLSTVERWVVSPMLGLLSGWLSLAVFLNLSGVIKPFILAHFKMGITPFAIGTLGFAIATAIVIGYQAHWNRWYGGTILWGVLAIMVTNIWEPNPTVFWVAFGLSLALLGLFLFRPKRIAQ